MLVLHEETLGGATRVVLRQVGVLRERGYDVSVWCAAPSPLHDALVEMGYRVDGAPRLMRWRLRSLRHPPGVRARLLSFPRALLAFRRKLRAERPDLVHVNGRLAIPEALVARLSGFRVVLYMLDDALPGVRGMVGRVAPWLAAHQVLSAGRNHGESMRIGRRVPIPVFAGAEVPAEPPARDPAAPVVVGTVGVLVPRKGTDLFIDAATRVLAAEPGVEFRIAGGFEAGVWEAWGREQARRAEAAGIVYLGHTDVARQLTEWTVMVLPARGDPFPLAVLEALAAGLPVVGTAVEGIEEQLAGGVGVLVPPEDPAALADAILALVRDPRRRAELGGRAHREALARYTIEASADSLEAAWRQSTGVR